MAQRGNVSQRVNNVAQIIQIRAYTGGLDQLAISVLNFSVRTIVGLGGTLSEMMTAMSGLGFWSNFRSCLSTSATFLGVSAQVTRPAPGTAPAFDDTDVGAGTIVGDPLPSQVCGLVTWRTVGAGRRERGRTYVPFPPESRNSVNGLPDAAYITALDTWAAIARNHFTFGGGGNTTDMILCILHRSGVLSSEITAHIPRGRWGTQRRRGSSGRHNAAILPG